MSMGEPYNVVSEAANAAYEQRQDRYEKRWATRRENFSAGNVSYAAYYPYAVVSFVMHFLSELFFESRDRVRIGIAKWLTIDHREAQAKVSYHKR